MELATEAEVVCPYCGEVFLLQIDTSQPEQLLVEDCAICCRPIKVSTRCEPGSIVDIEATI
jgi:Cysteine-rich CPXCG